MGILGTYGFFSHHKLALWLSLAIITAALAALSLRMHYSEDISDFLPLSPSENEAVEVYQEISGASRIIVIFDNPDDADLTVEAIDCFLEKLRERDSEGWCADLSAGFDLSSVQEVASFVYDNIPYFLTETDYRRMDSLLARPGYVREALERDKQILNFPSGGIATIGVVKDPLSLYAPVLSKLQNSTSGLNFEIYDGCIFTPDMSRAIVMMNSPFGNSETNLNSRLLALIDESISAMSELYPEVKAHSIGGPVIAVGNAGRIKKDSIIAVSLSVVLIVLLLAYSFNSLRNILLVLLSIGWGWLFALGGISLFSGSVSIIVIGISSIILGIAVNYPLHLVVHLGHQPDKKEALREIMQPLVVGNITTVGAFLALVPLKSAALRDLGIFASLLLVGTIIFVLFCLPHFVKLRKQRERKARLIGFLAGLQPEKSRLLVAAAVLLSVVFLIFSLRVRFDSNISNINYMTAEQRSDMQYFESLLSQSGGQEARSIFLLSSSDSPDGALEAYSELVPVIDSLATASLIEGHDALSQFFAGSKEQERRLRRWDAFRAAHSGLTEEIAFEARTCGFSPKAFRDFTESFNSAPGSLEVRDSEFFTPLSDLVFSGNFATLEKTGQCYVVDNLKIRPENIASVKARLPHSFDISSINRSLAENLSDNFNYIGWVCSLIVFFFLWLSFGRLELAIISFLPMAVSWVWILGIMALAGIQFNIVNIILATFIFGQGDDYTIFMTEGCQHEYTHGRPILASYKAGIIQSALIMFIGMGTLIVARHPAMHSLAQVTIIGMFSVVLMAYMIPPLLFRWLTTSKGLVREHPLTIGLLLRGKPKDPVRRVMGRYIYKGREICSEVRRNLAAACPCASPASDICTIEDHGYGETAILYALTHPEIQVRALIKDEQRLRIARISAENFVNNIEFVQI
ncbi:MAG: MMPL family transporter [Bacteroidales bacterium]|nr:MMPL family transporter [Bacteroidales bacterium]